MKKKLAILRNDPWLEPFAEAIEERHKGTESVFRRITADTDGDIVRFANAYGYYGLHRDKDGNWIFRELAPNATDIWLTGTFSDWENRPQFRLHRLEGGVWEARIGKIGRASCRERVYVLV